MCLKNKNESSGNSIYGTAAEPRADLRGKKADCQIINKLITVVSSSNDTH